MRVGGLVFEVHRLFYHSTLGLREIKKKEQGGLQVGDGVVIPEEEEVVVAHSREHPTEERPEHRRHAVLELPVHHLHQGTSKIPRISF